MKKMTLLALAALLFPACSHMTHPTPRTQHAYLDYSGMDDVLSGGVKMIPVHTAVGDFHVWTKRIGNNPRIKVLLLHGGPGLTHEYLEAFDSYFPAAGKYEDPQYMNLLMENYYRQHILRMPPDQWPNPVMRALAHLNPKVYVPMQGPSELGASGKLLHWDRTADLPKITVPTLIIAARHGTMDPKYLEMMAHRVRNGRYLLCPNGSHLAIYDDQKVYMQGIIAFIRDVDTGPF
jgi:hypothetical protein